MKEENSVAGQVVSGKEVERAPHDLARKSKIEHRVDMNANATTSSVALEKTSATKCDDKDGQDEFVSDVLMRFGIQI